jgi:solute carrier family 13 (sodium-dependent dicarboxylate transporter), member 2/3/5
MTAGITVWIALWWITEAIEIAITALLPLVLFPLCGVAPLKVVSGEYGSEIVFLFMAGFFFGKCIEYWNLHRRIALRMVAWLGTNPSRTVLGFMTATAFISMWISNTATAVMMTPVAIAMASTRDDKSGNFAKSLLLGVGYACSIGGLATIIGTPTNAIFLSFVQQKMGISVSFGQWLIVGFPFALILLLLCWRLLLWLFPLGDAGDTGLAHQQALQQNLAELGRTSVPEQRLLFIFGAVVVAWISGSLVWYKWFPNCNDTVVALVGAITLFLWPAGQKQQALLNWETAVKIPWGIILLFGGGLALAKGFDQSGLALWLGERMQGLNALPQWAILLLVLSVVVILSEIASNIATASMMMPVLAALAPTIGMEPLSLLMGATLAASVGFGLPIATAPNTIVFSSGYLKTRDMARAGFLLDVIAIFLLLVFMYTWMPWVMSSK